MKLALSWLKEGASAFGLTLKEDHLKKFSIYLELLLSWNRIYNLTAYRTEEEVSVKGFLDSLAGFMLFEPQEGERGLDLGSGPGFPGIPLRLLCDQWDLTLLESRLHAVEFLKELLERLSLSSEVRRERAESAAHKDLREKFDCVFARAVARLNVTLELGLPFLKEGGVLLLWKGGEVEGEVKEAKFALEILGGQLEKIYPYKLPYFEIERNLLLVRKIAPTPPIYPRRPGIPAKRPLSPKFV